jgi:hypothetical protein
MGRRKFKAAHTSANAPPVAALVRRTPKLTCRVSGWVQRLVLARFDLRKRFHISACINTAMPYHPLVSNEADITKSNIMKAYKITATAIDNNGVKISSNTAETLGEAFQMTYLTRERADEVRDYLASDLPEGYESSEYAVEEIEIEALKEGNLYDVDSVAAVMQPLPAGQNVADYFSLSGAYRGADENGTEIELA